LRRSFPAVDAPESFRRTEEIVMDLPNTMPSPDEAREIDYALQKVRFALIVAVACCGLAALVEYFVAGVALPIAILTAAVMPAGCLFVWTAGLRDARRSLSPFRDARTGKLRIPGGRRSLPFSHVLRIIFWDRRETRVTTIGMSVGIALLAAYIVLH
jgi:hypothetical protein